MSRRTERAKGRTNQTQLTGDSFQNFASRVGIGTQNQASGGHYGFSPISRNRTQLEWAYRSSWLAGKAVDAYSEDMTREGVTVKCEIEPDQLEQLESALDRLDIWGKIKSNCKWARLYGGSIAVLLIDGQKPETPLNFRTIGPGQFKGLLVLDRWVVQPSLQELITELGPDMGKPIYYDVIADAQALVSQRIHHSRVIRLDGIELPYWQRIAENGWGQSVLERLWDRLLAFDSTTEGAAQLVYKAHLRTYSVEGLRELIAAGGKAMEGLVKQIEMIRQYQSNEGMTLMDGKDKFESHSYSFAGLSDMLIQFGQQLSGAMDIPLVRLFGQSPAGLNSTGESDMRNYYDGIKMAQESHLREGMIKIYKCAFPSVLDMDLPEGFDFDFNSLWQVDDNEKADIAGKVTTAVNAAFDSGIIDRHTALKELRASSEVTGIFSNITDDDITEAENEPPPDDDEPPPEPPEPPGKTADRANDFDESKHPRGPDGKFGNGSGSGPTNKEKSSYKHGGKDQHGFERAPGLNKAERGIEQRFINRIRKAEPELIKQYHEKNGNLIDPDAVKLLSPEFENDRNIARAVHEPSSHLSKKIYTQALERKAASGDTSPTILTAGGSGSGKGHTLDLFKAASGAKDDALVYDSTLSSFTSATGRIEQALSITKGDVDILYTNAPIVDALRMNAARTRTVSIDTMIHAHAGAAETIKRLAEHYKGNPRVNITVLNNDGINVAPASVDDVPKYDRYNMRDILVENASGMYERGEIGKDKIDILLK